MRALAPLLSASLVTLLWGCSSDDGGGDTQASSAETGSDHDADHDADHDGDHDHSIDSDGDDPAVEYCQCMLINCHETYHGKFGEDEIPAQEACIMEADGLPMNGSDVDAGNFLECRQHFCAMATDDACPTEEGCDPCDKAIGSTVCM